MDDNCMAPARLKAGESVSAGEDDFLSKKLKTGETTEADLPSDVEFSADAIWENQTAEEFPAADEDDELPEEEEDLFIKIFSSFRVEPAPLEEEDLVEELTDEDSDTEDYDPEDADVSEADMPQYKLYVEDYKRSKGFDIHHFFPGGLLHLFLEDEDCFLVKACKKTVEDVINYENAKNGLNLKLEKITNCNYNLGTRFFATYDAIDDGTGVIRTFQAEACCNHFSGKTTIFRFREKPGSQPEATSDA